MEHSRIAAGLTAWARSCYGRGAAINKFRRMPGNSGFSFGFDVENIQTCESLVIRLPPPGAARLGNSDVLKQVRILRAAYDAGIAVPEVRWSADENPWFDSPFYIATLIRGESTHLFDAELAPLRNGSGLARIFAHGMSALATIHSIDWQRHLDGWSDPRGLTDEIEAWVPTLLTSDNTAWIEEGLRIGELLTRTRPADHPLTVVHGDFYSNNWLFDGEGITAILDWEIAGIGAPALDLGWICMIYDKASWGPLRHHWNAWSPTVEYLTDCYLDAGGVETSNLSWYRALAGYRLACITARNYRLHISGKRPDPAWNVLADSFPFLLRRAEELVAS